MSQSQRCPPTLQQLLRYTWYYSLYFLCRSQVRTQPACWLEWIFLVFCPHSLSTGSYVCGYTESMCPQPRLILRLKRLTFHWALRNIIVLMLNQGYYTRQCGGTVLRKQGWPFFLHEQHPGLRRVKLLWAPLEGLSLEQMWSRDADPEERNRCFLGSEVTRANAWREDLLLCSRN